MHYRILKEGDEIPSNAEIYMQAERIWKTTKNKKVGDGIYRVPVGWVSVKNGLPTREDADEEGMVLTRLETGYMLSQPWDKLHIATHWHPISKLKKENNNEIIELLNKIKGLINESN